MNLISLCSHKAVFSLKHEDAELLQEGITLLGNKLSETGATAQENQKKLHRILKLDRKLLMCMRFTESKEQRKERLNKNE